MSSNKLHPFTQNDMQAIFAVLDIKLSVAQNELINLNPEESNIYGSLPYFDKQKVDRLRKEINQCAPDQILPTIANVFQPYVFSPTTLNKLISHYPPKTTIPKPIALYAMFNALTFLYFQRKVVPSEQFTFLIYGLLRSLKVIGCTNCADYFFQKLMVEALTYPLMFWDEGMISSVCDFILSDTILPVSFYFKLVHIFQIIISRETKSCTDYLFYVILKLYKNKRPCIMTNDQSEMMKLLTPFSLQLNTKIFDIVAAISLVSQCPSVLDIYINFVNTLIQHFFEDLISIKDYGIPYKIPDISGFQVPQDFFFISNNQNYYNNGLLSLPNQLFDKFDLYASFPSPLWGFISIISPFLGKSSPECTDHFFNSLQNFLSADLSNNKDIIFNALISIILLLKANCTPKRIRSFGSTLRSKLIFDPNATIFQKEGLNPVLNYFRNEIITLLLEKDPDILIELFNKNEPLLYVELLGRLLALNYKLTFLSLYPNFFSDVIDVAVYFHFVDMHYHDNTISSIRSIIFKFLMDISKLFTFTNQRSINNFFRFFFETSLSSIGFKIFQSNLCSPIYNNNYTNIVLGINNLLRICYEKLENDNYNDLVINIAKLFYCSSKNDNTVIKPTKQIFDELMRCFEKRPSNNFLVLILKLISIIAFVYEDFSINNNDIYNISKHIINNQLYDKQILSLFMYILSSSLQFSYFSSKLGTKEILFVERPQFITLFIASFGICKYFEQYIKLFSISCQYSQYIARKCHDGYLDEILIKFLSQESENAFVDHHGLKIQIKVSLSCQTKYIIPMISSILSSKTSYSTAVLLHKLCENNSRLCLILTKAIQNCSLDLNPSYLLSTINMKTKSTLSFNLDKNFSISFWVNFHYARILKSKPSITLFEIKKSAERNYDPISLKIIYYNSNIVAQYNIKNKSSFTTSLSLPISDANGDLKESKHSAREWHFFGFSFTQDEEFSIINVYFDGNCVSKMWPLKIPILNLQKGQITIKSGKCTSNYFSNCCDIGLISNFDIYNQCLSKEDFHDVFKNSSTLTHVRIKFHSLSKQFRFKNLIDYYYESWLYYIFLDTFHKNKDFDFLLNLKLIFSHSKQAQRCFNLTSYLSENLLRIDNLNFSHYMKIYSIFEKITDKNLQIEWIDSILLKSHLWMKSDPNSKELILSHWTSVLLFNYSKLFSSKSRFTEFFVQFELYFDDERLREPYIIFLSRLALISFNSSDAKVMLDIIFGSYKKEHVLPYYLQLLRNIVSVFTVESQNLIILFLNALLYIDNGKNTHQILFTLHEIPEINYELEAIILSKILLKINNYPLLFKNILSSLNEIPNFYSFFCAFALSLDNISRTFVPASLSFHITTIDNRDKLWFFWPIILSFNIEYRYKHMILIFLVESTLHSQNKSQIVQNICNLFTLLSASGLTSQSSNNIEFPSPTNEYLSQLCNTVIQSPKIYAQEPSFISELINQCLYTVFFHLNWKGHNDLLLQEYMISPFAQFSNSSKFVPISATLSKTKLETIDEVIQYSHQPPYLNIGFQVLFTKTGQIESFSLLQHSLKLLEMINDKSDYSPIIKHFTMHAKQKNSYIKLFDKMRHDYSDQFIRSKVDVLLPFSKIADESKLLIDSINQFSFEKYEELMHKILINPNDPRPRTASLRISINTNIGRSRSLCYCGIPAKMQNVFSETNLNKCIQRPLPISNPKQKAASKKEEVSFEVLLITIRRQKKATIIFTKAKMKILINSKECVLTKQLISSCYLIHDTKLEILTKFGKNYLIDASPHANTSIVKYLMAFCGSNILKTSLSREDWRSNFEYLMKLNFISGRTFNDPELYPVFPQVLNTSFNQYQSKSVLAVKRFSKSYSPDPSNLFWEKQKDQINISQIIQNNIFIAPEFYFFPEIFSEKRLPPWANGSKYEFVYKMRKLLESPTITKYLPSWIDVVWGADGQRSTDYNHKVLFQHPHPQKELINNKRYSTHQIIVSDCPLLFASFYENNILCTITSSTVSFFRIVSNEGEIRLSDENGKLKKYEITESDNCNFFLSDHKVMRYDRKNLNLSIFSPISTIHNKPVICYKEDFKGYFNSFIFYEDNSSLKLYDSNKSYLSEKEIVCYTVSQSYSSLVYATIDGSIHIISIPSGKPINTVDLKQIPTKMLITSCWGFIVILCGLNLTVMSINGYIIKTYKFEYEIKFWKTFRTNDGFDYIFYVFDDDKLGVFEVMYPEKQCSICDATDLIDAHFIKESEVILTLTKSGKIAVYPIPISTFFSGL